MEVGEEWEVKWLPYGEPVPEGWEVMEDTSKPTHHNNYAILIGRKVEDGR